MNVAPYSESGALRAISETPRGSRYKYKYSEELGAFELGKVLPEGHVFPYDFGYIPGTCAEDGDALDVLILTDEPIPFPGCVLEISLIGVIEAEQTERDGSVVRNDRLLARASVSRAYAAIQELSDIPGALLDEIEKFFISYNAQEGKKFKPLRRRGSSEAEALVRQARRS